MGLQMSCDFTSGGEIITINSNLKQKSFMLKCPTQGEHICAVSADICARLDNVDISEDFHIRSEITKVLQGKAGEKKKSRCKVSVLFFSRGRWYFRVKGHMLTNHMAIGLGHHTACQTQLSH